MRILPHVPETSVAAAVGMVAALITSGCALSAPLVAIADDSQTSGSFKIQGGGASTLQSGRRITITRGVNLDNTQWEGQNLKGVAFQQSVIRNANFKNTNLFSASFFDADLANTNFQGANMNQCNLEMADLSKTNLKDVDLTEAYITGAVLTGLTDIEGSDWSEVDMRKDQRTMLCKVAKGTNPKTGVETRESLMCPE